MINANGELVLKTRLGEVTNGKIYAYQTEGETQNEVVCKFEQRQDGTVLKADSYDTKKELIIDPFNLIPLLLVEVRVMAIMAIQLL